MKILDVEVKFTVNERIFIVTTDSLYYPLLERSVARRWFVPRSESRDRYEINNPEFVKELEQEYRDYIERTVDGCF